MSHFEYIFNETGINEGKLSIDPNDNGLLTYKGISKRANQDWEGFDIIYGISGSHFGKRPEKLSKPEIYKLNQILDNNKHLQTLVRERYYYKYYIDTSIHLIDDKLTAFIAYEIGFMSGDLRAIQTAVNIFKGMSILDVDGVIGSKTIEQLNRINEDPIADIKDFYNIIISVYMGFLLMCDTWEHHKNGWEKRWLRTLRDVT